MRKIAIARWMRIDAVDGFHSFAGSWMRLDGIPGWTQMLGEADVPTWVRHMNIVIGRAF